MALNLVVVPEADVVSLEDVKRQCRVLHSEQDDLLSSLIPTARMLLEEITGVAFAPQTWELTLDAFPAPDGIIRLPRRPIIDVERVQYVDGDGETVTWSSSQYIVDSDSSPARIAPAYGEIYPVPRCQLNAVRIRFTAGHANDSPSTLPLPDPLRQALLMKVQELYDGTDLSTPINSLLAPYQQWGF